MSVHETFTGRDAKLVALADAIELSPNFNMNCWGSCIAFHAVRLFAESDDLGDDDVYTVAAERLGLEQHERRKLMLPGAAELGQPVQKSNLGVISREWAAATLRDFARTGTVNWLKNKSEAEHA